MGEKAYESLDTPADRWVYFENFVYRADGVVACYRRDDWQYALEIINAGNKGVAVALLEGDISLGHGDLVESATIDDGDEERVKQMAKRLMRMKT